MGLGGIARDSIVGLNKLVHDDEEDEPRRRRSIGEENDLSWNHGPSKGSGEFLFLDADDALGMSVARTGSFEAALNDGPATSAAPSGAASAPSTTPRSSAAVAAATSYNKVSATNSRSLDSYRASSEAPGGAPAAHYKGFQYEGYADYYSDEYACNYDEYSYAGSVEKGGGENKNIFCCLFAPWMQPKHVESEDAESPGHEESEVQQHQADARVAAGSESCADEVPTPSGEMESLERRDTMPSANPPKPQPSTKTPKVNFADPQPVVEKPTTPHMLSGGMDDSVTTEMSASLDSNLSHFHEEKKQEENVELMRQVSDIDEEDEAPAPIKGILKVRRCSSISDQSNQGKKGGKKDEPASSPTKRHLFPTYEPKKARSPDGTEEVKSINFNPMARVLTIPSRKDIPLHQKAQVWWQKCDYDEFKKTGRIISKAMECGGSEIWLASSNAWGSKASRSRKIDTDLTASENASDRSHSEEYRKALSKYVTEERKDGDAEGDSNKWWCKFGHSRRGLEHVASSSEGRARQQSVLMAIRMVLEEQKRQRASRTKDPNKLRNVCMQYTSWARDLALAAGAADAEAVASNFDPTAACRAQHFAKRLNVNSNSMHKLDTIHVGGGVAKAVTSQILDANTHGGTPRTKSKKKSMKDAHVEHDRSEDSLSRRAKGFMPGGGDDVSAAALLSGSGIGRIRIAA
ncbi:hypothetical protein ACHAXT_006551 [Thalassiosira profunda]